MLEKLKNIAILLVILVLSITAYAIWGDSGLIIALVAGVAFEGWFWHRITRRKKIHS
jgi:hypothetical protein